MKTQFLIILFLITGEMSFAQKGGQSIDQVFELLRAQQNISYFEVTGEMFKMLSETKEAPVEFKEYVSKLSGMEMVRTSNSRDKTKVDIYKLFMSNVNLKDFSRLMTSESPSQRITFFQKKSGKINEYLLVQSDAIIYITGTLDLKSISEFERVMEIAGSAFEM